MSNRIYNTLFHTHTVSGLLISVGLYVIFFAGSFSFFRDEIVGWERNESLVHSRFEDMDLNLMMDTLNQRQENYGRDISFSKYYEDRRINVNYTASKDTTAAQEEKKGRRGNFFYMNVDDYKTYDYASNYSIGEFLYRLHFLAQLNLYGRSGYMIAGIISFFFLFAIVTGVLVHWKKIISNFYLFRPGASFKNLWTDAHTALGIIGLPYQFVYAVTGVFLIIGTTIMSPPVVSFFYDGNTEKMYEDFGYKAPEYPLAMDKLETDIDLNAFVTKTKAHWPDFKITGINLYSYGDANMQVEVAGVPEYHRKLLGEGKLLFNAQSGEVLSEKNPFTHTSYIEGATGLMDRLHFGDFGGIGLKVVYFILGLISCFVIISGILIWLVARDKKHVAPHKRKFNAWLGWLFLAVCLSMFPATAFTFVGVKLFVVDFDPSRMASIYHLFFYSWLALSLFFTFRRDNYITNKYTLLLGSGLGFLVPIANGMVSGNWIWDSYSQGHYDIFLIDALWLALSVTALVVGLGLKRKAAAPSQAAGKKAVLEEPALSNG
jgi:uncharacterized iron-regulated membrane protein